MKKYEVMRIEELIKEVENVACVGKWQKGVKEYALELLEDVSYYVDIVDNGSIEELLLNGANNWVEYSYSGNSLIYTYDIAKRLADEGTLKKTKNGELEPNSSETWLDVQARALYQAYNLIVDVYNDNINKYAVIAVVD